VSLRTRGRTRRSPCEFRMVSPDLVQPALDPDRASTLLRVDAADDLRANGRRPDS